ncbi:hypothetical protein ACTVZO_43670 [Streptomyces sp. IBSNAI002]|uniref:hypothetical protein n=1 Tax=Streptomyces sp. IBSNAI002 TaxID=3457500 RepID=UPI003FD458AA
MDTNRRARRGLLAGAAVVALAATSGVAHAASPKAASPDLTVNKITTLGFNTKVPGIGLYDSEFRYDGYLVVDKDVKITNVTYSAPDSGLRTAVPAPRGKLGTGEAYSIVDTKTVGDKDIITFSLTGDTDADEANDCPNRDRVFPFKLSVKLSNNATATPHEDINVTRVDGTRCSGTDTPTDDTMRPGIRIPFDKNWGGSDPNWSQAGFSYIADDGMVKGGDFPINLYNPRQTEKDAAELPGSVSDHVLYQVVRSDGTPANDTLDPQVLKLPSLWTLDPTAAKNASRYIKDLDLSDDPAGYYKVLVWPQAQNQDGTPNAKISWDPGKQSEAWQIGSIYNQYKGPDTDPETPGVPLVNPGIAAGVAAVGALGAAGVYLSRRRRGNQTA